jgi:adenylate cyclase
VSQNGSEVEIERKFLVEPVPSDLDAYPSSRIEQGYIVITDNGVEVRIRQYGDRSFLTIKSGGGEVRLEEDSRSTSAASKRSGPSPRADGSASGATSSRPSVGRRSSSMSTTTR